VVLVLGLETSSRRGSVALLDSGRLLAEAWHDEPNAHGERLIGLIDGVLEVAGIRPNQLDRVAVGRGPGAFTGLRVGLALAQGISSGLAIPAIGVGSLRAMAAAMGEGRSGSRWPVVNARRGEMFIACYREDGVELVSPRAVPRLGFSQTVRSLLSTVDRPYSTNWLIGNAVGEIPELAIELPEFLHYSSDATDWPQAAAVGGLGSNLAEVAPASPDYLRDADAVVPHLPPCPLNQPMEAGP
jgi:tRNA threonylcarbamoyladenosine biosynthesis protein TsaB